MPDFVRMLYRSQKDQAAATPPELSQAAAQLCLGARNRRWFDPCPSVRPAGWDGLVGKWRKFNFVNPPWNQGADWVSKAISEAKERDARSVLLLAARTHTQWFARAVFPHAAHIFFITNRVTFKGYSRPCPVACALYMFGGPSARPAKSDVPQGARLVPMPSRLLDLGHHPTLRGNAMSAMEAVVGRPLAKRHREGIVRFLCVREHASDAAAELLEHHVQHPSACTVAMFSNHVLNTNFVCASLVPLATEVWFFTPTMKLDDWSPRVSATGSIAFVLGKMPAWGLRPRADRTVHFLTLGAGCSSVVG